MEKTNQPIKFAQTFCSPLRCVESWCLQWLGGWWTHFATIFPLVQIILTNSIKQWSRFSNKWISKFIGIRSDFFSSPNILLLLKQKKKLKQSLLIHFTVAMGFAQSWSRRITFLMCWLFCFSWCKSVLGNESDFICLNNEQLGNSPVYKGVTTHFFFIESRKQYVLERFPRSIQSHQFTPVPFLFFFSVALCPDAIEATVRLANLRRVLVISPTVESASFLWQKHYKFFFRTIPSAYTARYVFCHPTTTP